MCSGCGVVGRVVSSAIRDRLFESSHRQFYFLSTVLNKCIVKDENKEKMPEWSNFTKELNVRTVCVCTGRASEGVPLWAS